MVHLTCCCCGEYAGRWKQWWNRDDGYGCCAACVEDELRSGMPQEEVNKMYGLPGVHRGPAPSEQETTV